MKKQWRTIIISGGVLAALLVTWLVSILLPGGDPAETSATTAAIPAVFETAAENVTRIDVSNKSGQYALLPVETQDSEGKAAIAWRVEGKESYPFSSTALTDLANAAIKVAATAEVVANSADLASYGLDKPLATMTVTLKTGEKHVIKYGNELVSGSAAYVMLDDSGRICSVDSDISDKTGNSFLDLLDKTQVVGIEKNDLTNLTFERAKDGLMLVAACTLVGESDSETASLEFSLSEPLNIEGDSTALTTLAEEATGVSASKFIELDPKDLSKYGLDNPQYSFVLKSKDKTVLFKIGKMADGENYYATSDAMPAVFTIASNSFTTVDKKNHRYGQSLCMSAKYLGSGSNRRRSVWHKIQCRNHDGQRPESHRRHGHFQTGWTGCQDFQRIEQQLVFNLLSALDQSANCRFGNRCQASQYA